jgi:hypothetical protein
MIQSAAITFMANQLNLPACGGRIWYLGQPVRYSLPTAAKEGDVANS